VPGSFDRPGCMGNREIISQGRVSPGGGDNVGLVTVVATVGSTPGKVGYKMLVTRCVGDKVGTIGGDSWRPRSS